MKNKTTDMTQGRPLGLLMGFAVPLMLGSLCQLLYTTVDSAVAGRLIGVDAFAAVGAANFLTWLVYEIIFGLVQGFGVLFAQVFGRKAHGELRKAVSMSVLLSVGISAVLTAAGLFCARPVLVLMNTPAEILPGALLYVRWMFGGVVITLANRFSSTLLLALGNSRAPVMANAASCVLNIVLDLVFVGVFHWGVAGVAAATIAAQIGSFAYCFRKLYGILYMKLSAEDFAFEPSLVRELLRLGGPMAFRSGVIAVGGLFVQAAINSYGKLFVAGMAASEKFFGLISLTGSAFEGAFATYSAQNYGAGKMGRLKEGLRCCILLSLAGAVCVALLVVVFGREFIGLLVAGEAGDLERIIQSGYEYLVVMALTVPLMFLLCLYRSGLQGMGSTFAPTLSGFTELGLRLVSVVLLSGFLGRWAVYFANSLGWLGAMILLGVSYHKVYRDRVNTLSEGDCMVLGGQRSRKMVK